MTTQRAFLTLTRLPDTAQHAGYNAWHQLDHLPENLTLPGVVWGDRWVCSPECAELAVGDEAADGLQYAIMYWFRDPIASAIDEWTVLNQRAVWWGRRPELEYVVRRPVGFLNPVKTYVSPSVLIGPEALPMRPHLGVHLTVSRLADPGSPEMIEALAEYDRETIPAVLAMPGVAGVSTYSLHSGGQAFGGGPHGSDDAGMFVRIVHLEGDPLAVVPRLRQSVPGWDRSSTRERIVLAAPFLTITPWQWSWFDESPDA